MDRIDPATRSRNMAKIRSKSALDAKLHNYLKAYHICHKMHPRLDGSPDAIVFPDVFVYVDGCFWHSCPKCGTVPKSRQDYWIPKLERTRKRDKRNTRALKRNGWRVIRIWEHSFLESPGLLMKRIVGELDEINCR
jgi:DNA mismatch endonuclease (patch repair protein)